MTADETWERMIKTGELKENMSRCSGCGSVATSIKDGAPVCTKCAAEKATLAKEAAEEALTQEQSD